MPGVFHDTTLTYVEHIFKMRDGWFPGFAVSMNKFFSLSYLSNDSLSVSENFMRVAELHVRIDTDHVLHFRSAFNIIDWFAFMGGM